MTFRSQTCAGWLLAGWVALAAAGPAARAAETESRDYAVLVDGKHAGNANMTIERQDDGTTTVSCQTDVRVTIAIVKKYHYTYRGREVWKDGRLQRLDSTCDDDGNQYTVAAIADGDRLRVRVNRQERLARGDVWLTSYWTIAGVKSRKDTVPLIDADTGGDLDCKVQFVAELQLAVAGQLQNVSRYKLTGKVQVDLWYDASDRMVRREWVEDGHRTVVELRQVQKR